MIFDVFSSGSLAVLYWHRCNCPAFRRIRLAVELNVQLNCTSARRGSEAGDGVDEGGLAGAVGADQADERAILDLDVDVVVGVQAAVGDGEAGGFEQLPCQASASAGVESDGVDAP